MRNTRLEIRSKKCRYVCSSLLIFFCFSFYSPVHAATLTQVRDLISTSRASTSTPHVIQFTTASTIPVSGKIVITPQVSMFDIPGAFDFEDVDIAVDTSGDYVERSLSAVATLGSDGVSVTPGTAGSITLTLNGTEHIPSGARVRVILGSPLAIHEASSTESILNPATTGSYRIFIETRTASDVRIESANTMIAVIDPVTFGGSISLIPPLRSNGLPAGSLAANNSQIEISLSTDELASCRYATTTNVLYEDMTGVFPQTEALNFYTTLTGHQNGTAYDYYVRCRDLGGTANEDDYPISFSLAPTPISVVSNGTDDGAGGHGGTGDFRGGSDVLYRSGVIFSGWTAPLSSVTLVQDGKALAPVIAKANGIFSYAIEGLERGTYTFFVYSDDSQRRRSGTFSSTMTLGQGTQNTVSSIILPPTIALSNTRIQPGDALSIFGEAVPGSSVQVVIQRNVENRTLSDVKKYTVPASSATSTLPGVWRIEVDTKSFLQGTYEVKAAATIPSIAQSTSGTSKVLSLGVGVDAPRGTNTPDLNQDKKVNLVDFSILLSLYGKEGRADFNDDGKTNLGDVSIMLFAWTG